MAKVSEQPAGAVLTEAALKALNSFNRKRKRENDAVNDLAELARKSKLMYKKEGSLKPQSNVHSEQGGLGNQMRNQNEDVVNWQPFVWTEQADIELLALVDELLRARVYRKQARVPWQRFLRDNMDRTKKFDALSSRSYEELITRFDKLEQSFESILERRAAVKGDRGLTKDLRSFGMQKQVYKICTAMHEEHGAMGGLYDEDEEDSYESDGDEEREEEEEEEDEFEQDNRRAKAIARRLQEVEYKDSEDEEDSCGTMAALALSMALANNRRMMMLMMMMMMNANRR
eukprot:Colp12_sorted_trinity150504_noHs@36055